MTSKRPFDYIVVGAGSAGCVLAARLSEDPGVRVLLLEAGEHERHPYLRVPAAFYELLKIKRLDWQLASEPEPFAGNRQFPLQRGRLLGGTGAVNGMTYSRGDARDYDAWDRLGAQGWGHADVLPYFKKAESNWRGETPHHGGSGPLHVTQSDARRDPFYEPMMEAAQALGYPTNGDIAGDNCEGFARVEFTIHKGRRASSAEAYLRPAAGRPNLTTITSAQVLRVVLDKGRATGVVYAHKGNTVAVSCDREVVLSGGAYHSPHLLMLSGIGDADALQRAGVQPVHDLPGVGQNLQDHAVVGMTYLASQPVSFHRELRWDRLALSALRWQFGGTGPLAQLPLTCWAFQRTDPSLERADVQFFFSPVSVMATPWFPWVAPGAGHVVTARNALRYPRSRGSVVLRSSDPSVPPLIQLNLLSDEADVQSLVRAMAQTRELMATAPLSGLIEKELSPSAGVSSAPDRDAFVRQNARPSCHPSCTCAMGETGAAVVDSSLRVRGIQGLRVADASVMPDIVGGNLNAPVIMIAEKAADLIKTGV